MDEEDNIPLRFLRSPHSTGYDHEVDVYSFRSNSLDDRREERERPRKLVRFVDRDRSPIPLAIRRL